MDLNLETVSQEVPQHRTGLIPSGVWWHCGVNGEPLVAKPAGSHNLKIFQIVSTHQQEFQCRGGVMNPARFNPKRTATSPSRYLRLHRSHIEGERGFRGRG